MKYKTIQIILAIIILASGILSFIPLEKACGPSLNVESSTQNNFEGNQCLQVQTSQYEKTFGIHNAHLGLAAFTLLFLVNFSHIKKPTKKKKQFLTLGLAIGSIVAIYFLYLQFFVLNALCKYCMVTDIGTLLSLGIIMFWKEK
ncbi:MAG TPA: vitamin K epoxide reductase family protein [Candidatus Nanoarchaeia archaeon]|nr:vitamin K epoxide reductase family protein [Candidatus Nanoarchaeia archaeon]